MRRWFFAFFISIIALTAAVDTTVTAGTRLIQTWHRQHLSGSYDTGLDTFIYFSAYWTEERPKEVSLCYSEWDTTGPNWIPVRNFCASESSQAFSFGEGVGSFQGSGYRLTYQKDAGVETGFDRGSQHRKEPSGITSHQIYRTSWSWGTAILTLPDGRTITGSGNQYEQRGRCRSSSLGGCDQGGKG